MKQEVRCIRDCCDSKRPRHYVRGDVDDIDPMNPVAMYFDGWAPGTKVYTKIKGNKNNPAKNSTKVIPGGLVLDEDDLTPKTEKEDIVEDIVCDLCGKGGWKNESSLKMHLVHCRKKNQG